MAAGFCMAAEGVAKALADEPTFAPVARPARGCSSWVSLERALRAWVAA